MLATLVRKPLEKKGWVYEEKYDGFRILAYKEGDRVSLMSRTILIAWRAFRRLRRR